MGIGLGLLAGLGQAAQGLPQGLQTAQLEEDKRRALAQQQQQFEESKFLDLPAAMAPNDLRSTAGGAPTVRIPNALAPSYAATAAKERELEQSQKRGSAMANSLRQIGTPEAHQLATVLEYGAGGDNEKTMAALEKVMQMKRESENRAQGLGILRSMGIVVPNAPSPTAPVGQPPGFVPPGPAKIQPTGMEFPPSRDTSMNDVPDVPGMPAAGPAMRRAESVLRTATSPAEQAAIAGATPALPPTGPGGGGPPPRDLEHSFDIDPLTGKVTVHIKPKTRLTTGDEFVNALNEKQALDAKGVPPTDPRYRVVMERMNELRTLMAPPGAGIVERGTMPWNQGQSQTPGGAPAGPRVTTPNPPITPEGETEKVGQRNAAIMMLESAGKQAKTFPVLQSGWDRAGLRIRGWLQGNTPYEALSDEEQAWVTKHEQLRNYFIASQMGLGPFRSPEMQAQLKEIIGKYWSPGTPARLQELANILRMQGEQVQGAETVGGRRVLPTPPRGEGAQAAPSASGNIQKWGRDAQGNPVRLP